MLSSCTAWSWQRCRNSQTWQWLFRINLGGDSAPDHLLDFSKEPFGLSKSGLSRTFVVLHSLPCHTDPAGRHPPLDLGEEQAVYLQQEPLLLADLPPLVEQHRDVVEVPQLRRPIHPLQAVEAERQQVVFQGGVQHERRPCRRRRWSGRCPSPRRLRGAVRGSSRWPSASPPACLRRAAPRNPTRSPADPPVSGGPWSCSSDSFPGLLG